MRGVSVLMPQRDNGDDNDDNDNDDNNGDDSDNGDDGDDDDSLQFLTVTEHTLSSIICSYQ